MSAITCILHHTWQARKQRRAAEKQDRIELREAKKYLRAHKTPSPKSSQSFSSFSDNDLLTWILVLMIGAKH